MFLALVRGYFVLINLSNLRNLSNEELLRTILNGREQLSFDSNAKIPTPMLEHIFSVNAILQTNSLSNLSLQEMTKFSYVVMKGYQLMQIRKIL